MVVRIVFACGLLLAAGFFQPASAQGGASPWPAPRPLGVDIPAYKPPTGVEQAPPLAPAGERRVITLREALEIALANNPALAARGWEVRAVEGRILQSGLIPNPELEMEVENFGGAAERRGFDSAEATLQLSQLIELGGKRGKRRRVAQAEQSVAGWEYEAERLDVYATTAKAFFDVLAAQRQVDLRQRQLNLARSVLETVRERVSAGRVTPLEETKARVEASGSRITLERARRELDAARSQLIAAWGGNPASFGRAEGDLDDLATPPPLDSILAQLRDNPLVQRWEAEQTLRRSALRLEQAQQIPDVTLSAGIRRFADTDDTAFVAGVSIPLPIFGVNPGGVMEAERRMPQGRALGEAAIVQVTREARQAYSELSAIHAELQSLTQEVLPGAQQAYAAAQTGYREGRFGFLDVLDAQRTLFEARARHVEALGAYHRARTDLERLTGRSLAEMASHSR